VWVQIEGGMTKAGWSMAAGLIISKIWAITVIKYLMAIGFDYASRRIFHCMLISYKEPILNLDARKNDLMKQEVFCPDYFKQKKYKFGGENYLTAYYRRFKIKRTVNLIS